MYVKCEVSIGLVLTHYTSLHTSLFPLFSIYLYLRIINVTIISDNSKLSSHNSGVITEVDNSILGVVVSDKASYMD